MPRTQLDGDGEAEDGTGPHYGDWQRQDLLQRAHELDVGGRAAMTKPELVDALHGIELHGKSQRLPSLDHLRPGRRSGTLER